MGPEGSSPCSQDQVPIHIKLLCLYIHTHTHARTKSQISAQKPCTTSASRICQGADSPRPKSHIHVSVGRSYCAIIMVNPGICLPISDWWWQMTQQCVKCTPETEVAAPHSKTATRRHVNPVMWTVRWQVAITWLYSVQKAVASQV